MNTYPNRIAQIITDLSKIFAKPHLAFGKRFYLAYKYFVITLKNFAYGKSLLSFVDCKHQKLFGVKWLLPNYYSFYIQFRESFVEEIYHFKTDQSEPKILDCGGNIGVTVNYFKFIYPDSKVTVFEPSPETFKILKHNTSKLKDVELINAGLAAQEGEITFYNDPDRPGLSTMNKEVIMKSRENEVKEVKVKTVTLSKYIEGKVSYIKMDIEGVELEVLRESANKLNLVEAMGLEHHRVKGNALSDLLAVCEPHFLVRFLNGTFDHSLMSLTSIKNEKYLKTNVPAD